MTLPTEHEAQLEKHRRALLDFIKTEFAESDSGTMLTILLSITIEVGLAVGSAPDPGQAMVEAVSRIVKQYQAVDSTITRH